MAELLDAVLEGGMAGQRAFREMRSGSLPRLSVEGGLAAVVATQLWHHLYIDHSLCDLPV